MKMLNIKTDGVISFVLDDLEIVTDTSDANFKLPISVRLNNLISELQAANFQEIHMELNSMRVFTHKVGINSFEELDSADHEIFTTMETWADAFRDS
jgi:hypothetical protein